ncbi:helix-turn-helix transcriptional regulator [Dyella subtropica]|uniref:helix-turn-helix transcriptional regulator n=1 Tax=Dyella subtropica TaxID=2992127 RepID=UPI00225A3EAB|nr:helix-turn-helix transcriptional regulator [Dyella subtropica]
MSAYLGRALKLVRTFHDVSQVELASNLHISRSYLSEVESGKKTPSMDLLNEYAKHFSVPLSSLVIISEGFEEGKLSGKVKKAATEKALRLLEWVDAKRA